MLHFISIFAKNSSEDNSLNPVFATWLAGIIMLPFSVYLTSRATKDRALIDMDAILIPLKKRFVKSKLLSDSSNITELSEIDKLKGFENHKLIDLIQNYRQYGFNIDHKNYALNILEQRGVSELELRMSGQLINESYENGVRHLEDYHENATLGVLAHSVFLIFGIIGLVLNNNGGPEVGNILVLIAILSLVLFLIVFPKVLKYQSEFYKILNKKFTTNNVIFIIVAFPLFFLYRLYFNRKMKEDLAKIS